MALTEIQLKICRLHGSLSQKGSRPLPYSNPKLQFKLMSGFQNFFTKYIKIAPKKMVVENIYSDLLT